MSVYGGGTGNLSFTDDVIDVECLIQRQPLDAFRE